VTMTTTTWIGSATIRVARIPKRFSTINLIIQRRNRLPSSSV
jgi:hypothetical protein